MSWSLAANWGSLDSLKRLTRCGCRPCAAPRLAPRGDHRGRPGAPRAGPSGATCQPPRPSPGRSSGSSRRVARRGSGRPPAPTTALASGVLPGGRLLSPQQPVHALGREPFLPPPHRHLGAPHLAHDRKRAQAVGGQQHDPRPVDMLSAAVPIRHDRLEPSTIVGGNLELDPCAHAGIVAEPDVQRDSYDCISALGAASRAGLGRRRLASYGGPTHHCCREAGIWEMRLELNPLNETYQQLRHPSDRSQKVL